MTDKDTSVLVPLNHLQTQAPKRHRIECLDIIRGFIMVVMAWDHVKDGQLIPGAPGTYHTFAIWCGPYADMGNNIGYFIGRSISNICAPGFFYTMGIGMTLYTTSRLKRDESYASIVKHFAIRGVVLLLVGRFMELPDAFPNLVDYVRGVPVMGFVDPTIQLTSVGEILYANVFGVFQVMDALGYTMMLTGIFVVPVVRHPRVGAVACLLGGIAIIAASNIFVIEEQGPNVSDATPWPRCDATVSSVWDVILRFLIAPGILSNMNMTIYPVIPWIGVTMFGVAHGTWYMRNPNQASSYAWALGLGAFAVFAILRSAGGVVGNLRGRPRGELGLGYVDDFISVMNVTKYPPSAAYVAVTLGINLTLLSFFHLLSRRFPASEEEPENVDVQVWSVGTSAPSGVVVAFRRATRGFLDFLLVYGRVPLFFYAWHFYVIYVEASVWHAAGISGIEYYWLPLAWVSVIGIMYFPCQRYNTFKSSTPPTSLWRLF